MTTFGLYGAAFHWQYGDILLAIYFFVFTYYVVLSLKNKYTILYYCQLQKLKFHLQVCPTNRFEINRNADEIFHGKRV